MAFSFIKKLFNCFTLSLILFSLSLVLTANSEIFAQGKNFLTVGPQDNSQEIESKTSPMKIYLSESPEGIRVSISYINKQALNVDEGLKEKVPPGHEIPVGGELTCFLDDMLSIHHLFKGEEFKTDEILDTSLISNGTHTLRCEINSFPGGRDKKELAFQFDATPIIDMQTSEEGKGFDPLITLKLLGQKNDNPGYLEVYIDEQLIVDFSIKPDQIDQPIKLSELIGRDVGTSGLLQGTHLLRISAIAPNGSKAVNYVSFEVDAKPEVSVNQDSENRFISFAATFPKAPTGYLGNVDVYFKQGVIFSIQVKKDPQFTLTRSDIEEAFKKHHHTLTQYPVDLVIAVRAGNGTENWTHVEYR